MLGLFLWFFGIKPQTRKLMEESKKLQLKLNQIKAEMQSEDGEGFISGAIGNMGAEGIVDALGIPGPFKTIAKGFIDQILKDPAKLKALADKFGVKIPGGDNGSAEKESGFL
jgi:hypothetical protein